MQIEKEYYIRVVCYALDIMEQFRDQTDELGSQDLSRRLRISHNRVVRLLATLESMHYLEWNECSGKYRLGIKSFSIAQAFKKRMRLQNQARPVLEAVVRECNESASVAVVRDSHVICLDTVEADHPVRIVPFMGLQLPTYCTAVGKIQLAYMNDEELDCHISNLELKRYTPATITDRGMLRNNLSKAFFLGYAVDNEEFDGGVRCVGAPIRDYTSRVVAAISVSLPSMRFSENRLETELIPLVRRSAEQLSVKLGYHGKAAACSGVYLHERLDRYLHSDDRGIPADRSSAAEMPLRKTRSAGGSLLRRQLSHGKADHGSSELKFQI